MRMIRYFVIDKATNIPVYTDCRRYKCVEHINRLENKDQFAIGYKWMSI